MKFLNCKFGHGVKSWVQNVQFFADDFFRNIITVQNVENINTECGCSSPTPSVQTILTKLPEFLFIKVGRCKYDTTKIYKRLNFNFEFQVDYPVHLQNYIHGTDTQRKIKQYVFRL